MTTPRWRAKAPASVHAANSATPISTVISSARIGWPMTKAPPTTTPWNSSVVRAQAAGAQNGSAAARLLRRVGSFPGAWKSSAQLRGRARCLDWDGVYGASVVRRA